MKLRLLAAMTASMALAAVAHAQEQTETSGPYVGAGFGQFNAQIHHFDQIDNAVHDWNNDDSAYKIFAGYRLNRFLGFEAAYVNLGKPSGEVIPGTNAKAAVDGWAPYVVGTVPLGRFFELYGRAGYYFYDANMQTTDALDNTVKFKEDSDSFVWGGGIGANFGEKFNLRAEYERYDLKGLDDADALWLTAAWRF
jgi:opacity protein-like surface antigen